MPVNCGVFTNISKIRNLSRVTRNFTATKVIFNQPTSSSNAPSADVPGLSEAVFKVPEEPVGPGASKQTDYKNPEYFSYDKNSYFEAEVEMLKYRCPQPSVKEYYDHGKK